MDTDYYDLKLTRAQRRRLKALAEHVDRCCQSDRRFFERFPHRQHRVRLAGAAEIEQARIAIGHHAPIPVGCRHYTVVKNVASGARLRLFAVNCADDVETDISETTARVIWEQLASDGTRTVEANIRKAIGGGS